MSVCDTDGNEVESPQSQSELFTTKTPVLERHPLASFLGQADGFNETSSLLGTKLLSPVTRHPFSYQKWFDSLKD